MQRSDGAKPKVHAGVATRQPRPTHPDKLWDWVGPKEPITFADRCYFGMW